MFFAKLSAFALLLTLSSSVFAQCLSKEQAVDKASQLFIDEYLVKVNTDVFGDLTYYFYESNYPETKEGAIEAFFTSDYTFNGGVHEFSSTGGHGEGYLQRFEVRVTCAGDITAKGYTQH